MDHISLKAAHSGAPPAEVLISAKDSFIPGIGHEDPMPFMMEYHGIHPMAPGLLAENRLSGAVIWNLWQNIMWRQTFP